MSVLPFGCWRRCRLSGLLAGGVGFDEGGDPVVQFVERRTFTLVYTAYLALSLTDPALAIAPLARNSNAVSDVIAAQLRTAQAAGDIPASVTPGGS